jgi:hypothetical protein
MTQYGEASTKARGALPMTIVFQNDDAPRRH